MTNRQIAGMVASVAAAVLAALICLTVWHSKLQTTLGTEVFKLIYQFLLITVVGGLIAGLIGAFYSKLSKEHENRVADLKTLKQRREQLYDDYVGAISEILRLRFLIGARAIKAGTVVQRPYDKLMGEFVDVMLKLDSIIDEVQASPESPGSLYGPECKDLVEKHLQPILSYVNDIVNEYDGSPELFDPATHTCPLNKLPALNEFLGQGSKIKTQFVKPQEILRSALQRVLLKTD